MLTFLRKIRKSSINTGNAKKYLLYALGEILLVMLGILLALQVNNANENRKDRNQERLILNEIIVSLEKNNSTVVKRLEYIQSYKKSGQIILESLNGNIPYSDTLHRHFLQARFPGIGDLDGLFSEAGYKALSLSGYDIIRSDYLKLQIIEMFESTIPVITSIDSGINSNLKDYYFKNFRDASIPRDFAKLRNDSEYYEMIRFLIGFRERTSSRINNYLEESRALIKMIKKELEK